MLSYDAQKAKNFEELQEVVIKIAEILEDGGIK